MVPISHYATRISDNNRGVPSFSRNDSVHHS